jgi:hypothetical protein
MEKVREDWTQYRTDDEGDGPKFWELRDSFPEDFVRASFPTAVVIEWEYAEDGLPDQEALEQIHAFEQQITGLNNPTGNSIKVHIIRGSGLSELCYYVRDYDTFMRELNGALASSPKLPIQIEFFQDPEWQYRSSIISNFAS